MKIFIFFLFLLCSDSINNLKISNCLVTQKNEKPSGKLSKNSNLDIKIINDKQNIEKNNISLKIEPITVTIDKLIQPEVPKIPTGVGMGYHAQPHLLQ